MNVKRFTARTSRDALALVRQAFGDDAVVMSTRPCREGVEVLAMAPESLLQLERIGAQAETVRPAPAQPKALPKPERTEERAEPTRAARNAQRIEPSMDARPATRTDPAVEQDVEQLQMSTLSFQDYVRQRMLKRREAQMAAEASADPPKPAPSVVAPIEAARARLAAQREAAATAPPAREVPVLRDELPLADRGAGFGASAFAAQAPAQVATEVASQVASQVLAAHNDQIEMMSELRSMRGLIEQRFGALAFMEKLQRQPRQAHLAQKLLDAGFSPVLIRRLVERCV